MTFLAPGWLLLAGAAAVPILIHLLRRRIGARVELPTARYLARAESEHSRELRLRNIALLLARVAAIVLLAIAAARPLVAVGPGSGGPTAVAIVLDNSMSTGVVVRGSPVLDVLRQAGADVLAGLKAQDRAWLVTMDGEVHSGSPAALREVLASAPVLAGSGDLPRAVATARNALASGGAPGKIVILTDGQATQWPDASGSIRAGGAGVVIFAPEESPPANRAVIEASAEPLRWSSGTGSVNAGFVTDDSVLYRIVLDGRPVVRGIAEPDGRAQVRVAVQQRGWLAGLVEIERDELPADDVRHFAAFAGEPPAVFATGSGPYAEAAIATLVGRTRLRSGAGIGVGSADVLSRLPALITAPADPLRVGAANRSLERLGVPWRYGSAVRDSAVSDAAPALFGGAAPPSVLFRYRLEHIRLDTLQRLDTVATVRGEPWIVAGENYVLLGSALDPAHTSLPVSAGFIHWLERMLAQRLTLDARGVIEAEPGSSVAFPSWATAIDSPEAATAPARTVRLTIPGVYFLRRDGARVGAIVVNPPREESLLARLSHAELAARVHDAAEVIVTADATRLRGRAAARGRTDATVVALLLALGVLLLEMSLRRRGS